MEFSIESSGWLHVRGIVVAPYGEVGVSTLPEYAFYGVVDGSTTAKITRCGPAIVVAVVADSQGYSLTFL